MGIKLSKVAKAAKKYDHILIIMRHAKAEPFGDKGDSERELTDKGLKQAKAVGKGIESLGLVPDQISCSSVTRTRQTLDRNAQRPLATSQSSTTASACMTGECRRCSTSSPTSRPRIACS